MGVKCMLCGQEKDDRLIVQIETSKGEPINLCTKCAKICIDQIEKKKTLKG